MIVKVRLIPRAKKEGLELFDDGIKVYVKEPPLENRANKKLIEFLAQYYNTKKYCITIIKGEKQKNKLVEIRENR